MGYVTGSAVCVEVKYAPSYPGCKVFCVILYACFGFWADECRRLLNDGMADV